MKLNLPAASLLALALFAGPVLAEEQPLTELAQAAVPAGVQALLDDTRPLAELTVPELTKRIRQARAFIQAKNLPKDVAKLVQSAMRAAIEERASRQQASDTRPAGEKAGPEMVQAEPEASAPEAPAGEAAPAPAKMPPAVAAYLEDTRSASDMTAADLRARIRLAQRLAQLKALPEDTRQQIRDRMRSDRAEMQTKASAAQPSEEVAGQSEPVPAPDTNAEPAAPVEMPADVASYLGDTRSAKDMTVDELRARVRLGQRLAQLGQLPGETRQQIRARIRSDRAEMQSKPPAEAQTEPDLQLGPPVSKTTAVEEVPADERDVKRLDRNRGDPQAEERARAILADIRPPKKMSDAELRESVNAIRDLMSENRLSRETERLLRQRLALQRSILRARVTAERREERPQRRRDGRRDDQIDPAYLTDFEIVLRDRRNSEELADRELRRRIEVLLRAMEDERYEAEERARWRRMVERDRRYLRQRLVEIRRQRQAELRDRDANLQIGINLGAGRDRVIDAAESDDEEIEDVLVAAPRRKLSRRYSVEEVESSAELRDLLPRVEIDSIRFGFNESFVREEEVENLDRVGEILERVLAAHPREIFLIEGHTDAVGSDAYNLVLSRQRAVAVKEALSEYFVIPPENLRTAGYGERFLKIPTAEEEQENRRVSVSRATELFGQLDQ